MANGFKKDRCEWYRCIKPPAVLMKGHPYGTVVLCLEHSQCVEMAVEQGREFRHDVLCGDEG